MVFHRDVKQLLRSEPADRFRTQRVLLDNQGGISPFGALLTFAQMQAFRLQGQIFNVSGGRLFANLGVSLQLIVHHKQRRALVLAPQGDRLKLISGYVPTEHLGDPLQTVWAELMEEVLPMTPNGKLYGFANGDTPLKDPYALKRCGSLFVRPAPFLSQQSVLQQGGLAHTFPQTCQWPVTSYQDRQHACLQLVFPAEVSLPDAVTLYHVEDVLDSATNRLLSEFEPHNRCVLMVLDENSRLSHEFFTINDGEWIPFDAQGFVLSEFFDFV